MRRPDSQWKQVKILYRIGLRDQEELERLPTVHMPLFKITSDLVPPQLVSDVRTMVQQYPDDILHEVFLIQAAMKYVWFLNKHVSTTGSQPDVTMEEFLLYASWYEVWHQVYQRREYTDPLEWTRHHIMRNQCLDPAFYIQSRGVLTSIRPWYLPAEQLELVGHVLPCLYPGSNIPSISSCSHGPVLTRFGEGGFGFNEAHIRRLVSAKQPIWWYLAPWKLPIINQDIQLLGSFHHSPYQHFIVRENSGSVGHADHETTVVHHSLSNATGSDVDHFTPISSVARWPAGIPHTLPWTVDDLWQDAEYVATKEDEDRIVFVRMLPAEFVVYEDGTAT